MLFIEWNLRDFSPCWLWPSLNFACYSLLKARIEAILHMLGLQVIFFLFVPSLLPTVMDPNSVTIRFFSTLTIHLLSCNLDICQVVWFLDPFVVPTLVYNKALQEGFRVCVRVRVSEHHKCFILPMHRLGCCRDCCILCRHLSVQYLTSFGVYLIAAVSFSNTLLHLKKEVGAKPLYWLL